MSRKILLITLKRTDIRKIISFQITFICIVLIKISPFYRCIYYYFIKSKFKLLSYTINKYVIIEMHIFNLQNQPIPKYEHATFNLVLELYDTKKGTSFFITAKSSSSPTTDTQSESCTWNKNPIRANLRMIIISWYFHRSLILNHANFYHI